MKWDDGLDKNSATYKLASSEARIIRSVAGPGSGKSFAIRRRIIRLLETGINPEKMLAITFTRTAAGDLRNEITSIGIKGCEKVTARTVHSHALIILHRSETKTIVLREPRMVIDHEIAPALRDIEFPPETSIPERKKMLETYLSAWANKQADEPGLPKSEIEEEFSNKITEWLKYHNGMLVGEVIPIALRYLQKNPASPEIGRYDVILVDEYQDLNRAEQEFIKLITGNKSIVIVGDDDQSIYGFKNAHPDGIREIGNLYGEYDDILFNEIRRCPQKITQLASNLISKNNNRTLGKLTPFEKNQEGDINILQWSDNSQEIEGIVKIIKHEIDNKLIKPKDVLILAPRRLFGYTIKDKLILNGIPAESYFREDIITNKDVQRAYSLLYLLAFPEDKIALRYLVGYKISDYRLKQYKILKDYVDTNRITFRQVLDSLLSGNIKISSVKGIIDEYRKILNDIAVLKRRLLDEPENIFEYFYKGDEKDDDFNEIISLFQEILSNNPRDDTDDEEYNFNWIKKIISKLAENIALPDNPVELDHVRIMSLHSSKGLSAKFVIMISMIDELIPFVPKDTTNELKEILEEQRRLFYVAMTRCKSSETEYPGRLIISSFVWINGIEASRVGIKANPKRQKQTQATRFLDDFGNLRPKTLLGSDFLSKMCCKENQ